MSSGEAYRTFLLVSSIFSTTLKVRSLYETVDKKGAIGGAREVVSPLGE